METQRDGWPVGVSAEAKVALIKEVKDLLSRNPYGLELWVIVKAVQSTVPISVWPRSPLLDYQYATIVRAVRGAGALNVWRLKKD